MEQALTLEEGTPLIWRCGELEGPSRITRVVFLYAARRMVIVQSPAGLRRVYPQSLYLWRRGRPGRSSWFTTAGFKLTKSVPWKDLPEWLKK